MLGTEVRVRETAGGERVSLPSGVLSAYLRAGGTNEVVPTTFGAVVVSVVRRAEFAAVVPSFSEISETAWNVFGARNTTGAFLTWIPRLPYGMRKTLVDTPDRVISDPSELAVDIHHEVPVVDHRNETSIREAILLSLPYHVRVAEILEL